MSFKNILNMKYINKEEMLLRLISFEELIKINYNFYLKDDFLNELPNQFFKIIYNKEKQYFNIDHLCEDLLNIYDYEIQFLLLKREK